MATKDEIIKSLIKDVKSKCAERIQNNSVLTAKIPIEEYGVSSIMKKRRGL